MVNFSKKNRLNKGLNKVSDSLINVCNEILVDREKDCNCFDNNKYPKPMNRKRDLTDCLNKKNTIRCRNYNKCKKLFSNFTSGYEPHYDPDDWSDPLIEGSHNCYMYFLNDKLKKVKDKCFNICKDKGHNNNTCQRKKINNCGTLKPQPGNYAYKKGYISKKKKVYNCNTMINKVLKDNYDPSNKRSRIKLSSFSEKCPKHHYKGSLVVDPGNTYHFYRQDNNVRYSHKQGTLRVENIDSDGKPIYAPHLAGRNYNKSKKKNGIDYLNHCAYMCVPNNYYNSTHAMGRN
tara:strand:- start:4053 stop:4919 length:867 start_codon:yes stop_codon:yes gene_type:complete